jgi:Rrf2 family protein
VTIALWVAQEWAMMETVRTDSRLSRMLHVLLHMARHDKPFTSGQIAKMLTTNPVVVRRTMAGLRRAGFVRSEQGHGGGWTLSARLNDVSLLDVYQAVGSPGLFLIGTEGAGETCAVARVVDEALAESLRRAEKLLLDRFAKTTLADLAKEFDQICKEHGWTEYGPPSPKVKSSRTKK